MDRKQVCSLLRVEFNKTGLVMLLYYCLMSLAVSLVMAVDTVWMTFVQGNAEIDENALLSNGWGYILAIAVGCLIMLLWKKPRFCFREIWKKDKPMTAGSFFALLCIFISGQALFQVFALAMEWLFNLVGLSVLESIEAASQIGDTFSMFLYGCIMAPIFEEVLFRGLILRTLQPYGKKFAVFASAFLFGIFHGNIVQSPFAFVVGLVLGHVAVEYHMGWAILLHMINNLVLADLLPRVIAPLPLTAQDLIFNVINWGCAVAAVIICIVKRKAVREYLFTKRIHPWCMRAFFTSPTVLIFSGVMLINILLTIVMQLFQ